MHRRIIFKVSEHNISQHKLQDNKCSKLNKCVFGYYLFLFINFVVKLLYTLIRVNLKHHICIHLLYSFVCLQFDTSSLKSKLCTTPPPPSLTPNTLILHMKFSSFIRRTSTQQSGEKKCFGASGGAFQCFIRLFCNWNDVMVILSLMLDL